MGRRQSPIGGKISEDLMIIGRIILMKKRLLTMTVCGLALLTLAGCGQQGSKLGASSSSSSSSLLVKKTSTKINPSTSPQQSVALITAYAGNKYGNGWATTAKKAQSAGLQVNLYQSNKYKLADGGQGVAYSVTAGGKDTGLLYTMKGNDVILYSNNGSQKLGTVSRQQMANYINQNGQGSLVKQLAGQAKVVDKTNGQLSGGSSNGGSSSSSETGKYGNQGPFTVPAEMRGTWYTSSDDDDGTVTLSSHSITTQESGDDDDDNTTLQLFKQDPKFLDSDQTEDTSVADATKNWGRAQMNNVHGMNFMTVQGWCQTAGDGESYAVHTETVDGQQVKVLVVAGGAGFWTDAVYYQSKSMAQHQGDHHFSDLTYRDDE